MNRPPAVAIVFFVAAAAPFVWRAIGTHHASERIDATTDKARSIAEADAAVWRDALIAGGPSPAVSLEFAFDPADPAAGARAEAAGHAYDPDDAYGGLPKDDGVDEVAAYCAACHSLEIVMQQRASETRWRALLDWMIAKQGMAPMPDAETDKVIAYLSRHFTDAPAPDPTISPPLSPAPQ